MAYIGTKPTIGNFQICDAISVVNGQAAYTMQVGSVNVIPQSSNHMIVSLNSTIQRSGGASPSFTVSGSTITFASNLVTGDVIDFIHILGDVLDLGVPSDATVTDAKTNFVSTSSAAGLQIKGDGTTDGTLQLNCSQNSHGIKLKSPPHSAGASYTLTFPSTGLYYVNAHGQMFPASGDNLTLGTHVSSNSGGAYDLVIQTNFGSAGGQQGGGVNNCTFVNVTNASTFRIKFTAGSLATNAEVNGNTDFNFTNFTFIRLGDSQ